MEIVRNNKSALSKGNNIKIILILDFGKECL